MTNVINSKPSRRERKKEQTRTRIIAAALDLFAQNGIDNVTVDDIAAAADIGKGTFYNYFETKEDIVVAFMVDMEPKIQAEVQRLLESARTDDIGSVTTLGGDSLPSILTEYIRFQFRLKEPYHRYVRVFLGQMLHRTEHLLPYLVEMQKAIDPPLESLFQELQERRLIRPDVDITELVLIFKTMHMGLTAMWAIEGPPFSVTESLVVREMTLFCQGLATQPTN